MKFFFWLLNYFLIASFCLVGSAGAEMNLVSCNEDATCTIKIYRSDQPILLNAYTIYLATEQIGSDQVAQINYDGVSTTVTCNGNWQNLPSSAGLDALQNKIRCDVIDSGSRITADLTVFDQDTYDHPFATDPGDSGYAIVSGTSESAPYCQSEESIAKACVWQVDDGDQWLVYGKTTVTGLYLGASVPEGTSNEDCTPSNICMEDADGNGSYSANEFGVCSETPDGALCLIDAVMCTETTSDPICPDSLTGAAGFLNTETDICEDTPEQGCSDPGYVWDESLQKCIKLSACLNICPTGYSYNSTTGKCVGSPCADYATYNPNTNRCETIISYTCPATDETYSSKYACDNNCVLEGYCEAASFRKVTSCYTWGKGANCSIPDVPFNDCDTGSCTDFNAKAADYGSPIPTLSCSTTAGYTFIGDGLKVVRNFYTSGCARSEVYYDYWAKYDGWASGYVCSKTGQGYQDVTYTVMGTTTTLSGKDLCETMCVSETQACTSTCGPGYTLVSGSNICIASPLCSYGGTLTASGTCELEPNFKSAGCLVDPDQNCANGYAYNPTTGLCEAYPICEAGSYRSETNDCFEGNNTCPYGSQWPCMSYNGASYCSELVCMATDNLVSDLGDPVGSNDKTNDGEVDEEGNCIGEIYIFNGQDKRCRDWGLTIAFANCCKDEEFLFGFNQCKESEIQLALLKGKGVCHKVGNYCSKEISLGLTDICIETSDSYCCFNSKLARIVHEQGRSLIQGFDGWGDAESPQCRGFTPEEFQMLDFSKINLDEWIGDIQVTTQENIANDISTGVNNFYQEIE